jgi:SAM-dependent methyltransferase
VGSNRMLTHGPFRLAEPAVYTNGGNAPLVEMLDVDAQSVLDVGCGSGDNARLRPDKQWYGITASPVEAERARPSMRECWVADVERAPLDFLGNLRFHALIFSHVLEHLRDPVEVLVRFLPFLRQNGSVLIALPNVLGIRQRIEFCRGRFLYADSGVMDRTHLRFFTYETAARYLVDPVGELRLEATRGIGGLPLWIFRRYDFSRRMCRGLDRWGVERWPNLFAGEILLKARKKAPAGAETGPEGSAVDRAE